MSRTIPVTRTDGSEVAGEATQALIKAKTDNLDIALSALRDALRGTSNKTNTDIVTALGQVVLAAGTATIGKVDQGSAGASPWAQNLLQIGGASLTLGQKTGANSLPVVLSSDGPFTANFGLTTDSAVTDPDATASHMSLQKGQLTKLVSIDGGIGGASAAAAGDTGASTTNGFLRWMRDFWLALRGTKTAANSLSVTGASDGVFYVGGVSADGQTPTNQAVRVSGVDAGGLKRTFLTNTDGSQIVTDPGMYSTSSSNAFTALNTTWPASGTGLAVPSWARSGCIVLTGTFSLTVTPQVSFDGGVTWISISYSKNLVSANFQLATAAGAPQVFEIPPGVTHIQAKCFSYSSGTAGVVLAYSGSQTPAYVSATASLSSSAQRIGSVFAPGIWYDDTSAALTANSTFTSTARDITATASATAWTSASTYAKEYRVMAEQDVAFTLQIQASRDNSTFRVIQTITATNVSGGGYVAEAVVSPKWRYYRYAIVNGASNAARTTGGSILMAN